MRPRIPRTHSRQEQLVGSEDLSDAEAAKDFWSIQFDFIYRHHNEMNLEFNSMCRRKKHYIPLKFIDVAWYTHTDLDVLQEERFYDDWNVDSNRNLSDSRRGFTKFTLLKEKTL